MKVFNFPFHTCTVRYPKRGAQVQLGGSYTYAVKSAAPVARTFQLSMDVMKWHKNASGILTPLIQPQENVMALDNFYQEHELHQDFIYPHELYGNVVVKFGEALEIPPAKRDSFGSVFGISITLLQQPV